jgi:Leucine-rich repeat (LRR) protein
MESINLYLLCNYIVTPTMSEETRVRVSRTKITNLECDDASSIGASYTWIQTLKDAIGEKTESIVMYHARLKSLDGFEKAKKIQRAYLACNLIYEFRPEDALLTNIEVLDLIGNPIKSLKYCPPCKELIVSCTLIENLIGCPDTVEILRIGHSTHLKSLEGCPSSVRIIECNCAPYLQFNKDYIPNSIEEIHIEGRIFNRDGKDLL